MTLRSLLHAVAHLSVVATVFAGSPAEAQTTITVETTDQQSAAQCTLSDAINAINTWQPFGHCPTGQGVDTIRVPAGLYELATNAVNEDGELTALPYVTRPIRIVGDGPGATIIRRLATAPAMRLFKFQAPFEISGMTLAGGLANHSRGGGAILAETFNVAGSARMTASVRNMVFDGNAAPQGGALADTGFWYGPFVEFTLDQVVFTGNRSTGGGGAIYLAPGSVINATSSRFEDNSAAAWGGAIYNHSGGQVAISDAQFLRNISSQDGGAVHAASPVLTRVTFTGNQAARSGGALYSYGGRPAITGSTFTGNRARRGGAIEVNAGSVVIDASTFAANTAFAIDGGALWLDDRLRTSRVTNSTFSANLSASYGAIALINGAVTIVNSTIVFNTNTPGGWSAGVSAGLSGSNEVFLSNSIVAGNTSDGAAADLRVDTGSGGDRFVSLGHNLIGSNEYVTEVFSPASGDLFGTMAVPLAAGLLPLADNGGPTLTHALAAGSPAFDAGSLASPGTNDACLPVDQRGSPRPGVNTAACDIGAVESEVLIVPGGPTTTSVSASLNPSTVGEAVTFTAAVTAEPGTVGTPTGVVTFTDTTTNVVLGSSAIDAAGTATLTTSALPVGLLTIQAAYAGDGVFTSSSSTLGQTVVAPPPAPTATTLVSSVNPAMSGAPVTLTATVTALAPGSVPAGSVAFVLAPDNTLLGAATLDAAGVAALTISTLPEGTFQIDATYVPAGLFLGSAASLTQAVSPLPDAAIRNGVPESRAGFNGVGIVLSGMGRPTCTATMVSQFVVLTAAQCVRNAALADVSFSLGDGRMAPAAAVVVHPQFETADGINPAFDAALVLLDRDAAAAWSDVTRASLAATPPARDVEGTAVGFGAARTSGQLLVNDFLAGEGPVGVPILDAFIEAVPANAANQMFCEPGRGGPFFYEDRVAGVASFRSVGTCAEPGPGYYLAVSRLTAWVEDNVGKLEAVAPTTISLSSSRNPSVENQLIAFVAVVSGLAPDGRIPTGTVTFDGAGAAPMIIALVDGKAVLAVADLSLGLHTVRATYSGDARFAPGETTIEQVVRIQRFPLTITWTGPGDVVDADLQPVCAASPCVVEYDKNSTVTLRPRANTDLLSRLLGVTFLGWTGDCSEVSCTVTMTGPKVVSASFVNGRRVTVSGEMTRFFADSFTPCPHYLLCDGIVRPGIQVTITAYSVPHLRFTTWAGSPCHPRQSACTFRMGTEEVNAVASHETPGSGGEAPDMTPIARITRVTPGFGPVRATGPQTPIGLSAATSSDPDGSREALTFRWTAGSNTATGLSFTPHLPLGRHVITLEATDADGHTGAAQIVVTVADLTPPVISASSLLIDSATAPKQLPSGFVTAVDAVSGPVTVLCSTRIFGNWQTPAMLIVGENQVRCTARDRSGNDTTVTFRITLRIADLATRAEVLANATAQTPGATAAMRKAATRVATAVGSGTGSGVCRAVESYRRTVSRALSGGLVTATAAEPLFAIANEMLALAGC